MNKKLLAPYFLLLIFSGIIDLMALDLLYQYSGPWIYPHLEPGNYLPVTLLLASIILQAALLGLLGFYLRRTPEHKK